MASHLITVSIPASLAPQVHSVTAEQVNFPAWPADLPVTNVSGGNWQFSTMGRVQTGPSGDEIPIGRALVFLTVNWANGAVTNMPRLTQRIGNVECAAWPPACGTRMGLKKGDRRPRVFGSTQTISINSMPSAPSSAGDTSVTTSDESDYAIDDDTGSDEGDSGEGVSLGERWNDLPTWGQWSLGSVAGIGSVFGLSAIIDKIRK